MERRRQIIEAAQIAFSRTSLHGASTREIARAANVNPATLFEHFGSKEALFQASIVAPLVEALDWLQRRMDAYRGTDTSEKRDAIARRSIEQQMAVTARLFPLLTAALFSDLDAGLAFYRDHIVPFIRRREKLVEGLVRDGVDPYFLELAALGMLFVTALDERFGEGGRTRSLYADQFVRLFSGGAARRPAVEVRPDGRSDGPLAERRALGSSDLFVSPIAVAAGDTADGEALAAYIGQGGNFVDVGEGGAAPPSPALLDAIRSSRHDLVVAARLRLTPLEPDATSSSQRRTLVRQVEDQLGRLNTDRLDLVYLSGLTDRADIVGVLHAVGTLVRHGKVRHVGLTDMPVWQAARMQAVAEVQGPSPIVAIRLGHEAGTTAEADLLSMAREMRLGVVRRSSFDSPGGDRRTGLSAELASVAAEVGCLPAQVGLAWHARQPAVASVLVGAGDRAAMETCIAAMEVVLDEGQRRRLEEAALADRAPYGRPG